MTPAELEELLSNRTETPTLDYKEECHWDKRTFIKHILAMANNVDDGGHIVVGVKEITSTEYERTGVEEETLKTYDLDVMKDQVKPYADPDVDFKVDFPIDESGLKYVVIRVLPFAESPVICQKDLKKKNSNEYVLKKGVLYIRSQIQGRVQSTDLKYSRELQTIIRSSARNLLNNLYRQGLVCPWLPSQPETGDKDDALYEKERQGL